MLPLAVAWWAAGRGLTAVKNKNGVCRRVMMGWISPSYQYCCHRSHKKCHSQRLVGWHRSLEPGLHHRQATAEEVNSRAKTTASLLTWESIDLIGQRAAPDPPMMARQSPCQGRTADQFSVYNGNKNLYYGNLKLSFSLLQLLFF